MDFTAPFVKYIKYLARFCAKPDILFFALPWLMVLTVLGTWAQKDMGVYEATEKYFNSIILWLGIIPAPGGLLTIGIIFLTLTIKFIFFSPWNRKKSGTNLTHLGVLFLLLGGIITPLTTREGFMIIPEGQSVSAISNYRERVLTISDNGKTIQSLSFDNLKQGQIIEFNNLHIEVLNICQNCSARAPSGKYEDLQGLAENMELVTIPSTQDKEKDFSGLTLSIENIKKPNENGTYIIMEDIEKNPVFNNKFKLSLQREKQKLPFSITLKDFRKIDYTGTLKAKEFESDLIIEDAALSWPATISMNEPLRYKGYTIYQSSFIQNPDIEVTVLNVVQNKGQAFPYIASAIIFIGLLLHFIIRLQTIPFQTKEEKS